MEIDLSALAAALTETDEGATFEPYPVSEYVMRHIYEPLRRDEPVLFAELDFTAFDAEDLAELRSAAESWDSETAALTKLNKVFCDAEPISAAVGGFC